MGRLYDAKPELFREYTKEDMYAEARKRKPELYVTRKTPVTEIPEPIQQIGAKKPGLIKKAGKFIYETSFAPKVIQTLYAPFAMKKHAEAVDMWATQQDDILKRFRSEKDPAKKANLK